MRTLLIGQSFALICFTLVVPIEVIYAKESLGTTSAGFGLLLSAWGAGIVLGSLLFLWLKSRVGLTMILISSAAVGFAYIGMSQAQTLLVACMASIVGGAGNGVQWVAVMTALQQATPASTRRGWRASWSRSARRCPASASCSAGRSSRSAPPAPRS